MTTWSNMVRQQRGGGEVEIPGSETPLDHGVTVWQRLVKKSKAKDIVIVAHRYYSTIVIHRAGILKIYWICFYD